MPVLEQLLFHLRVLLHGAPLWRYGRLLPEIRGFLPAPGVYVFIESEGFIVGWLVSECLVRLVSELLVLGMPLLFGELGRLGEFSIRVDKLVIRRALIPVSKVDPHCSVSLFGPHLVLSWKAHVLLTGSAYQNLILVALPLLPFFSLSLQFFLPLPFLLYILYEFFVVFDCRLNR